MPPIAESIADTADCPWRNSATYIVICPSVMARRTVLTAIQAYAAYNETVPMRPRPKPQASRRMVSARSSL